MPALSAIVDQHRRDVKAANISGAVIVRTARRRPLGADARLGFL
jgi:hypothetical protein